MGISRGVLRQLFDERDVGKATPRAAGMGPVGSNADKTPVDVTIIARNEAGRWIYGEEIKADRATRERVLPRGTDGSDDRFYMRLEYEFAVDKLKRAGGDRPATLVHAAMPPGYASVFLMPLQSCWAKDSMTKLPEAYDTGDLEGLSAKFNPLGFTADNLAARRTDPDLKAIADIAGAERDIYLTKNTLYRASLAGALVSEAFLDSHPNAIDTRWVRGQSRTLNAARDEGADDQKRTYPEDAHRLGLVLAEIGSIKIIAAEIIVGLDGFRVRLEQAIGNGSLLHAGKRIKADANLDNLIDAAIELGVWQALAGTDDRQTVYEGAEVATLARRYAEHHLAVWNKILIKEAAFLRQAMPVGESGELLEGVGATPATQDQFEAAEWLARLDAAATERERQLLKIEMLKTVDLGWSPDDIADGIRLEPRRHRGWDSAGTAADPEDRQCCRLS